jgi:hypothetical protein
MPAESSVWDQITRVISLFATQEVKTPLSFVFRLSLYMAALLGIVLFAPVSEGFKREFMLCDGGVLVLLGIFVGVFAWFKPTNLVYGEAGHRAERRLEFGTNRKIRSAIELETERPVEDIGQLPPPEDGS